MGGGDPTVTWMQGQVQKQRCGDLSFVHNPDESDSCKAEGRERGERGEERGERGEQAQAALRDTHLAGKAAGVIQGCCSRRLEQGCPCLPPSLWREAQGSEQNLLEGPALPTSLQATKSLPCASITAQPPWCFSNSANRGWGEGSGTTESTSLHRRANTSRGADGSLAARIPQLPGLQAEGTEPRLLRHCCHKPCVVCRTRSRREGKG